MMSCDCNDGGGGKEIIGCLTLSDHMSICLSVCLSVCLFLSPSFSIVFWETKDYSPLDIFEQPFGLDAELMKKILHSAYST